MTSLRERRIANEWRMLAQLAEANPEILEIESHICGPESEDFHLVLERTRSPQWFGERLQFVERHQIKLSMPEYFPAVPMQVFLSLPVLHPNVHPITGFVCVWDRFNAGDCAVQTLRQLQRVISWELFNLSADHLMQPDSLKIYSGEPLPYLPLQLSSDLRSDWMSPGMGQRQFRSRLS